MARAAKKVSARKTTKRQGGKKGRTWNWKFNNVYVADQKKWTKEARLTLPAPKDTVRGCIFAALVAVKKGSDKDIEAAAIKMGLEKLTTQSTKKQVQMKLRRFAKHGVVLREKNTKKMQRRELRAQRAADRAAAGKAPRTRKTAVIAKKVVRVAPLAAPVVPPVPVPAPAVRPPRKVAPKAAKAPVSAPAPAVPPAPAAPNPANPPRPRPVLRAKPKPAPAPDAVPPVPVDPAGDPAPAHPVEQLLAERAAATATNE